MDVSDEEDAPSRKRSRTDNSEQERSTLKEENDSLRCQLEAYKNEVEVVRSEMKVEVENKEKQLKMLQQTLQGMQQQLIECKRKQNEDEQKVRYFFIFTLEYVVIKLFFQLHTLEQQRHDKIKKGSEGEPTIIDLDGADSVKSVDSPSPSEISKSDNSDSGCQLVEKEAKLIGIISTFLHVHPFGAGVDYVWSYVHKLEPMLKPIDVETLMRKYPTVFKQELSGIGANMERRWSFNGFCDTNSMDKS